MGLVLVLVPVVFVIVAAGSIADAAKLLGGAGGPAVETATAGWAAGFLAGIAMFFQIGAARAADRRLVSAGLAPMRLVAARFGTGLVLGALVAAAALLALAARTGNLGRAIVGTLMFAVIYLAIGALVGRWCATRSTAQSSSCSSGFWTCSLAPRSDPPTASKPGGSRRIS